MDDNHYMKLDERGKILVINKHTLEIVRRETDGAPDTSKLVRFETADGPVYYPKGIIPEGHSSATRFEYNSILGDAVCDRLSDGETMEAIVRTPGYPSRHVVNRWMRDFPQFRDAVQAAREERAEYFHDKVLTAAEDTDDENSRSQKVKMDAYKWAAEKGNPTRYGNKVTVTSEKIVSISVNTGFSELEGKIAQEKAIETTATEVFGDK